MTNDIVVQYTGIDPESRLEQSRAAVDPLVDASLPDLRDDLAALRAERDIARVEQGYELLVATVSAQAASTVRPLLLDVANLDDARGLAGALRSLELAGDASYYQASQLTDYFAALFADGPDQPVALADVISQSALYDQSRSALAETVRPESETATQLMLLNDSVDVLSFTTGIDALITRTGANDGPTDALSLPAVLAQVDQLGAVLEAAESSVVLHQGLVDAAASDAINESGRIRASAGAQLRQLGYVAGLVVATLLTFTLLLGRLIIAPLDRLSKRARAISDGSTQPKSRSPFLRELNELSDALEQAASQLGLVERQALALARGELDDPTLGANVAGPLGASLQNAVGILVESIEERDQFRHELAREAAHDGLTGLPNRDACIRHLTTSLKRVHRAGGVVAVMFIDLDGFKTINDNYGHLAGDEVLKIVAQRLVGVVRPGDYVARIGGDEFLIVSDVAGPQDAEQHANEIRTSLDAPISHAESWFRAGASIGLALSTPGAGETFTDLLRDADLALYRAKDKGRGRIEFCTYQVKEELKNQVELEKALKNAIRQDDLTLHYQPILDANFGVVAFEALLRWRRGGALIYPGDFIDMAERSDLIIDIDTWVLGSAASQLAEWSSTQWVSSLVAVNISARHLQSQHIVANLMHQFELARVPLNKLIVEITESALLDVEAAKPVLRSLREAGVRIAIDDYGTGHASLSYLRDLPFDIVKLDGSYVHDPSALHLVDLMISASHHEGAIVVAEGVETREDAERLIASGCDLLQGYYFGQPAPPPRDSRTVVELQSTAAGPWSLTQSPT